MFTFEYLVLMFCFASQKITKLRFGGYGSGLFFPQMGRDSSKAGAMSLLVRCVGSFRSLVAAAILGVDSRIRHRVDRLPERSAMSDTRLVAVLLVGQTLLR